LGQARKKSIDELAKTFDVTRKDLQVWDKQSKKKGNRRTQAGLIKTAINRLEMAEGDFSVPFSFGRWFGTSLFPPSGCNV